MPNSASMVNGFDMTDKDSLEPSLRSIVERRAKLLGPAYRLFYDHPVQFVRGEGVYLYDAQGTQFLDAYNNVPSVGHCHPHVVAAIAKQAATLNTHTRYVVAPLLDYAERLLATFPREVGNVMFTCSGSEAVDLALRIARFHTRGAGVIVTSNAYHGTTRTAAEISPSLGSAVPLGRDVWTVEPPMRSQTSDLNVGDEFADRVRAAISDMTRHGVKFAAFIADSLFSTDGIIPAPAGLLKPVITAVHEAGGLYIADEVQPGFGRTGQSMWGFDNHGIMPDLVVMGKPMGNGMPIAGVAVRPEVLEEFGTKVRYFNTFGGNSVSIAAANAVLDVMETEGLMMNSRIVGAYLKERITDIAESREDIGEVRGVGLYVGVDIVIPDSNAPDGDRAVAVVNGLRERQVLISATGSRGNVLKIRPPLPFATQHVDRLVEALVGVLDELG
jgi:4-aminobutyrate aminotransferase-like enzyme